ncbi:unnamed protein product, partial [Brassica rapa subsp. trilocularis]
RNSKIDDGELCSDPKIDRNARNFQENIYLMLKVLTIAIKSIEL